MPQSAWSTKRERQYEHIKESEKKQGRSTKRAKEIAARTVNKDRARAGETGTSRPEGRTKEQLDSEAKRRNIPGRSKMTKAQLRRAVDSRK
jgi:plasmid stabilization system protein ParE